jgi:hypothetical protein
MKLPGLLCDADDAPAMDVGSCCYGLPGHSHREFTGAWFDTWDTAGSGQPGNHPSQDTPNKPRQPDVWTHAAQGSRVRQLGEARGCTSPSSGVGVKGLICVRVVGGLGRAHARLLGTGPG